MGLASLSSQSPPSQTIRNPSNPDQISRDHRCTQSANLGIVSAAHPVFNWKNGGYDEYL